MCKPSRHIHRCRIYAGRAVLTTCVDTHIPPWIPGKWMSKWMSTGLLSARREEAMTVERGYIVEPKATDLDCHWRDSHYSRMGDKIAREQPTSQEMPRSSRFRTQESGRCPQ